MSYPEHIEPLIAWWESPGEHRRYQDKSGEFLYSSVETLQENTFYLLGTNPGGDPKAHPRTINDAFHALRGIKDDETQRHYNHYLDDPTWVWRNELILSADSPLSQRVAEFFGILKGIHHPNDKKQERLLWQTHLRSICASNLILTRTKSLKDLKPPDFSAQVKAFWPLHERIIEIVKPKALIVFGNGEIKSPYQFLKTKFPPAKWQTEPIPCGNRKIKWFILNRNPALAVIALPHLSYPITFPDDLAPRIQGILDQVTALNG